MGMLDREYLLHLPTNYQTENEISVALVLDFHGYTATAGIQILLHTFHKICIPKI